MHPDPAGLAAVNALNPQTWNRYAYVVDNPVSLADPTGLAPPGQCANSQNPAICQQGYRWGLSFLINFGNWDSLNIIPVWSREEGSGDVLHQLFAVWQPIGGGGSAANNGQPQQPQKPQTKQQCVAAAQAQHNTAMDEISNRTPWVDAIIGMTSGAMAGGAWGCVKEPWVCEATYGGSGLPDAIEGAAVGTGSAMMVWTGINIRDMNNADAAFFQQVNNVCSKLPG